jgi:hypothetical protein
MKIHYRENIFADKINETQVLAYYGLARLLTVWEDPCGG